MKGILTLSIALLSLVSADPYQQIIHETNVPISKSVAIIGGGASGTATAFWLSNVFGSPGYEKHKDIQISTTIFERNDYIGGRSTTVAIKGDETLGHLELGASIFVEANHHLIKATDVFGLERVLVDELNGIGNATRGRPGLGVWDGKEFLFEDTGSYWNTLKMVWRYGFTPLKFQSKQKKVVQQFLEIYDEKKAFLDISDIVKKLDLEPLVNMTAEAYLKQLGINERFSQEILQSAARGNYCQDLNVLHGLGVMVSMEASQGTWAVKDGNYRIFEKFAAHSNATVHLNTKVKAISNITEIDTFGNKVTRYVLTTLDGQSQVFDDVVLTTPVRFSGIDFSFSTQEEYREYHAVYVTLITGFPDPSYFGRTIQNMPTFVVTAGGSLANGFPDGKAPFETFSIHRVLENGESAIKIFSPKALSDEFLDTLFLNRTWTYRKGWHAFPKLDPVTQEHQFPSFILKHDENEESGIIYTNAFENFISTMETQTVSGKNAARLLYEKWCNKNRKCPDFGDGWGDLLN